MSENCNNRKFVQQTMHYTLQKIFEEGLQSTLKPLNKIKTKEIIRQKKQTKKEFFYESKLHKINTSVNQIETTPTKSKTRLNQSVNLLKSEPSDLETIKSFPKFLTIQSKDESTIDDKRIINKQRLKLRISVINELMMYSSEQLEEKCIDIFRKLAKPIFQVPTLERKILFQYLLKIFKNEQIVIKTMIYLQVPPLMNYKQYCNLIHNFNEWNKVDILFFVFYLYQENLNAFLSQNSLFQLITSEQCFTDDATFIHKKISDNNQLNFRDNFPTFYTKLLKQPNLTFQKYKQMQTQISEKIRRSKLEVFQIKTKIMLSQIKITSPSDQSYYNLPKEKEDEILVTFETFRKIYSQSHPSYFGWLVKSLGDIDIYYIGQKLKF